MSDDGAQTEAEVSLRQTNFETFKDCLSTFLIRQLSNEDGRENSKKAKRRSKGRKGGEFVANSEVGTQPYGGVDQPQDKDLDDLSDFIDYLVDEVFNSLPQDLQLLSYISLKESTELSEKYALPLTSTHINELVTSLPPTAVETVNLYFSHSLKVVSADPVNHLLASVLMNYIPAVTTPPPALSSVTYPPAENECELCERTHLPLTQHHLVPRQVAEKAVKRGWCKTWEIEKIAWLCRACHSFVHGMESNEGLVRGGWTEVERIREREDTRRWVGWVGGVRWKKR